MPRGPRLDVEGGVYHVMARGVERRAIFHDDTDRQNFLRRLETVAEEEDLAVFAYVLMDNHFHVVARRGPAPLGQCLRRLLTGHSVVFNRRHRRDGHLFQNRYRAVLCEADSYLLQLVCYVHLNPVRAGLVTEPQTYRWSSHAAYLRRGAPAWLAVRPVLEMIGGRAAYRRFIRDGYDEGARSDLCGQSVPQDEGDPQVWLGGQVFGDERFARRMARAGGRRELQRELEQGRAAELPGLAQKIAARHRIDLRVLRGPDRRRAVSAARRALARAAVVERGIRPVEVSRYLGVSRAAITAQLRAHDT